MDFKLELDEDQMKSVVSEAILRSLDEKKRDALVQGAIQHLLTPVKNGYYKEETPIQRAFNMAIETVANQVARETLLENSEVRAKMNTLLTEALERVLTGKREATLDRIAENLSNLFARD